MRKRLQCKESRNVGTVRGLLVFCRRKLAIQSSVTKAIEVPLAVMREARLCWPHMETLARHANVTVLSDLQVCAHVCVCVSALSCMTSHDVV